MISVIIPTFNEKQNINLIATGLKKNSKIKEVIFVDDNSPDGTYNQIKKLKPKTFYKGFQRKEIKKDLSKSVIFGVNKSINNIIVVMDCDLQHDAKYINSMYKKIISSDYDIVVASRFKNKNYLGNVSFIRSLISKFTIFLINLIFGKKSTDPLSGFFICKKEIIEKYKKNFFNRGYKILFDILYNGKKKIKSTDISISFKRRYYAKSKFNIKIMCIFLLQMIYTIMVVKK